MLNVVVGIIGAVLGGWLMGRGTINNADLSLPSLLVSFVGAVVLLAIVNLIRRGRPV